MDENSYPTQIPSHPSPPPSHPPPPEIKVMTAPSPPRMNGNSGSSTPARTPRTGTPVATHLSLGNKNSHRIREKTGYTDTRFAGKEEQFRSVVALLRTKGFIPAELIDNEVHT